MYIKFWNLAHYLTLQNIFWNLEQGWSTVYEYLQPARVWLDTLFPSSKDSISFLDAHIQGR